MTISLVNGVNPLQTTLIELGIVSGRVALLLRSAEIQPLFGRFVLNDFGHSSPSLPPLLLLLVGLTAGWWRLSPAAPKSPHTPPLLLQRWGRGVVTTA
jgi:hypothetical protein